MLFKKRIILLLLAQALCTDIFSQEFVTIYTDNQEQLYGRALSRSGIHGINLEQFGNYKTLNTGSSGVLTAVIVSSYVNSVLEQMFEYREKVEYTTTEIEMIKRDRSGNIYMLSDSEFNINFKFRLEKPSDVIYRQVDAVYGNNSYWHSIVTNLYRNNYVVRIYSAENIPGYDNSRIVFAEALFMATLIGYRHQPLWGIHDGLGYLDNVGYALIRDDLADYSEFNNYRNPAVNEDGIYRFIYRVQSMGPDFVQNLYDLSSVVFNIHDDISTKQLPEKLLLSEEGSRRDLALFYYDILTRMKYECKLAFVKKAYSDDDPEMLVVFRDKESYLWGIIGYGSIDEEIHELWEKTFAGYYNQDTKYYILNADDIFSEKKISVPDDKYWTLSKF